MLAYRISRAASVSLRNAYRMDIEEALLLVYFLRVDHHNDNLRALKSKQDAENR